MSEERRTDQLLGAGDPPPRDSSEVHEMRHLTKNDDRNDEPLPTVLQDKRPKTGRRRAPWQRWWLLELLAELVSIACMLAIVGILITYENKPTTAWPYEHFSLNSAIALLATVTRSALMVPVAACIGQRKWQWFLPSRRRSRAKRPAQRLGDFETFDSASRGLMGSLMFLWHISLRDLACIGAAITVMSLLFNTLTQNLVVTAQRTRPGTDQNLMAGKVPRSTHYDEWRPSADLTGGTTLQNPAPKGTEAGNQSLNNFFMVGQGPGWIWNNLTAGADNIVRPGYSVSATIVDVNIVGQSRKEWLKAQQDTAPGHGGADSRLRVDLPGVEAHECALWYCVQAQFTNVSFGNVKQTVPKHWNYAPDPRDLESDVDSMGFHEMINFTHIPETFRVEPDIKIGYSIGAKDAAYSALATLLQGSLSTNEAGQYQAFGPSDDGNALVGLWYAADDLNAWIQRLALSMSNNVRLSGTTTQHNQTMYEGTAWMVEVYIKVRWAWIIFPWALVVLSMVFLILTVIEYTRSTAKPWRNSATAMLYTRLDEDLQASATHAMLEDQDIDESIERARVRLVSDEGWVFRTAIGFERPITAGHIDKGPTTIASKTFI